MAGAVPTFGVVAPRSPSPTWSWRRDISTVVLVVALLAFTKGPVYRIRVEIADLGPGRDFIDDRWVQATFLAVCGALIAVSWPARYRLLTHARTVVTTQAVFVLVLIASSIWSIATRRTLEQGVMLAAGTAAFALAAARFHPARFLAALWSAMLIGVLASLIAGAGDWRYATDRNGDLAGIYFNRNSLGAVAAIGVLASVLLTVEMVRRLKRTGDRRHVVAVVVVVAGGVVDLTVWWRAGSLTPAFALVIALVAVVVVAMATTPGRRRDLRRRIAILVSGGAAVAAIVAVLARTWLTDLLGRSPTFSGRTEIWAEVLDAFSRRPVGGFGFMAVWFDPELRAGLVERGRDVYEAHSGYLEILVGVGVLGAVILGVVIGVGVVAVASRVIERADPMALAAVGLSAFTLAANLGETYIGANLVVWTLFVTATVQAELGRR